MKFKCKICGKVGAGRLPKGGDGTFYYPRKHKDKDGTICEGTYMEADWIIPKSQEAKNE